jgi:hypothetical protein
MYRSALIAGVLFAALGIYDAAKSVTDWTLAHARRAATAADSASVASGVDRSRKGDRLPLVKASGQTAGIATVEVIGLDAAAVVYRDRDGRELFRTEPLANVTVVAKGVRLPEVTIRERRQEPVRPMPLEPAGKPAPRLVGCDPVASPLAGTSVQHLTGRCIAAADRPARFASR